MDMLAIGTAAAAGLSGFLLGGVIAWRKVSVRASLRYSRLVATAREQLAASTQSLRTTNARLQAELEKERTQAQQRIAVGIADQRSSLARLESQLRIAYAEIDRLTAAENERERSRFNDAADDDASEDNSGFAVTRPYEP